MLPIFIALLMAPWQASSTDYPVSFLLLRSVGVTTMRAVMAILAMLVDGVSRRGRADDDARDRRDVR